jgi:uncharacterized repeat protein (TIGR01451 family)
VAISNGTLWYDSSDGTWKTGFRTAWIYTAAEAPNWTLIETPEFTTSAQAPIGITFRVGKDTSGVGISRVDDVVLAGVWEPHPTKANAYKRILLPANAGAVYAVYNGEQTTSYRQKIHIDDLVIDGDWFWEGGKSAIVYCRSVHPGTDYDFYQRNPEAACDDGYVPYDGPIPDNRILYMYWSGGLDSLNQQDLYVLRGDYRSITLNADGMSVNDIAVERASTGIKAQGGNPTVSNSRIRYTESCAIQLSKNGTGYISNALISGNEVDDVGCGIYLYQVRDSRVAGNRINLVHNRGTKADHEATGAQFGNFNIYEYNHVSDTSGGIDFYGTETYPTTNNIIRYNLVEYAHYQGMVFFGENKILADGTVRGYTYDNVVHNNVVRYSGETRAYCGRDCVFGGGAPGSGIAVKNTPINGRNYFYNNTLYANSRNFAGARCFAGGFTFFNNLSLNPTVRHLDFAGNNSADCARYNDNFAGATADHNLYWPATGTGLFDWHGVYNAFDDYAQATGQDSQGLAADPLLQGDPATGDFYWAGTPSIIPGAGDYRLTPNSPAIDRGTDVGLTTDIAGNPVQGLPDIGAYEGGARADVSVSVTDTPDPVNTDSPMSYSINVSNTGPSPATNVVLTHTLPSGVTGSGVPSQGSCTGTSVISCNLGTLTNDQGATVTVTATPNAEALFDPTSSTTFNVNISASTTVSAAETDLVPANNSATTGTNVRLACLGQPVTKRGTSGNNGTSSNRFAGTSGADVIHTLSGNDWIDGKGGNDTLCGGIGNDNLKGSGGADTLSGGSGTDVCNGGSGTDSNDGSCETWTQ